MSFNNWSRTTRKGTTSTTNQIGGPESDPSVAITNASNLDERELEHVLHHLASSTNRSLSGFAKGGSMKKDGDAGTQKAVDELLRNAKKSIDREEKVIKNDFDKGHPPDPTSVSSQLHKTNGAGLFGRREERRNVATSKSQQPNSGELLGSAGSSKASSNASDESEEIDGSGLVHPSTGTSSIPILNGFSSVAGLTSLLQTTSGENSLDDLEASCGSSVTAGRNSVDRNSVHQKSESPTEGIIQEHYNSSRRMNHNMRSSTVPLRGGEQDQYIFGNESMSWTIPDKNRKSGSQSDPSPCNAHEQSVEYHNKKQGRAKKLQKLTKYQSKKQEFQKSSNSEYEKAWDLAVKGGALTGTDDFLDFFATKLNQQKTIPKSDEQKIQRVKDDIGHSYGGMLAVGESVDGKKSGFRELKNYGSSKGSADGSTVVNQVSKTSRKLKVSDSEPEENSDHERERSLLKSGRLYGTFDKRGVADGGEDGLSIARSYGQTPFEECLSWENEVEDLEKEPGFSFPESDRPVEGVQRTSSGSSRSSTEPTGLTVGQYVRLHEDTNADADVDDVEKGDQASPQTTKTKKKKDKKKTNKKKSDSSRIKNSSEIDQMAEVPSSGTPTAVAHVPVEFSVEIGTSSASKGTSVSSASKMTSVPKDDSVVDQPESDTPFQVVTRGRLSAKSSPSKNYGSSPRYYIHKNHQNYYPSIRTNKQPVVLPVVPTTPDFPVMRRRNSAGDLKNGGIDVVPGDGLETGGDVSDLDSVRSMPVSKAGKTGGKTTSAPATRLPTPGISYADIAKGTHNGTAHGVSADAVSVTSSTEKRSSVEPVRRSDSSKSESEKDSRMMFVAGSSITGGATPLVKSVSADRVAVNPIAEDAPYQRPTPNQIISKAGAVDKLNRKVGPGSTGTAGSPGMAGSHQILPDLGNSGGSELEWQDETWAGDNIRLDSDHEPPIPPPMLPAGNVGYRSSQNFYFSDRGESSNAHAMETYRALMRTENAVPALAPRLAPVIYGYGPVMLPPIRDRRFYGGNSYTYHRKNFSYQNRGTTRQQNGGGGGGGSSGGGSGTSGFQSTNGSSCGPVDQNFVPPMAVPKRDLILQNQEEVKAFVQASFDEVKQKCLKGVPGYRHFKV